MLTLPEVHRRMATVVVDQQDVVRCIRQWDSPSTLFYVDPPYVGTEAYYAGGFGKDDHARLADALNAIAGRAVLSYYACPEVEKLYPARRWQYQRIRSRQTTSGNRPRDPNGEPIKAKRHTERTELILTNFEPASRRRI